MIEFQPGDEHGEHAPANAPALVFWGDVDRPEVEPGDILEIHGNAADGDALLRGDQVDVRPGFKHAFECCPGADGIAEVFEVEGVIGKAVEVPGCHLREQFFVPESEDKIVSF